MAASLITTIGHDFGSLVQVPEVGVFLNSSMVNFDPRPDRPNSIQPGKMPYFAVPAIVAARDGRAVFAAAGSGGYRILSGVVHAFVHHVDFGMGVREAVDAPRVYCQGDELFVDDRLAPGVRSELARLGHRVVPETNRPGYAPFARVSAVAAGPGGPAAASDPPWSTASGRC
jgi:gamma-glutamyltranspeptidase / glutathione hydrolase